MGQRRGGEGKGGIGRQKETMEEMEQEKEEEEEEEEVVVNEKDDVAAGKIGV